MKKLLIYILVFFAVGITAMIIFSPYGSREGLPYKAVSYTVDIDVPVEKVYDYLGNSANASDWSVFVDHITPLNTETVPDGRKGSIRRCFSDSAESEMKWDELITIAEPSVKRQLTIYNLVNFPIEAKYLATEQLYTKRGPAKSTLTFTVFFHQDPSVMDKLKMYLGAYRIKGIFENNMNNIKRILEAGERQS